MKRIYIIIAVMLMSMAAMAQEGKPFVTASLGTQGTGDVFGGAAVSLGAGYNWKGLDMGLALDYYNDKWGKGSLNYVNIMTGQNDYSMTQIYNGKQQNTGMTLRLVLAYDPLRFIRGNWRHHLRPTLGLGYSHRTDSYSWKQDDGTWQRLEMREQTQSGFELSLGIAYDFNITRHWSVGAYFEEFILEREQDILGLRARYAF